MGEIFYVDTRPGAQFFGGCGEEPYGEWIARRYKECQVKGEHGAMFYGVGQRINRLIALARLEENPAQLVAIGPHAGAVAAFIEQVAGGTVRVDVAV